LTERADRSLQIWYVYRISALHGITVFRQKAAFLALSTLRPARRVTLVATKAVPLLIASALLVGLSPGTVTEAKARPSSPTTTSSMTTTNTAPRAVDFFLVPHEDDEFETWSQVEKRNSFKVFIGMTLGEATGFCLNQGMGSWQPTEALPSPLPTGKHTSSCASARLNSWTKFFTQMSRTDPTVPGEFTYFRTAALPANGTTICRQDTTTSTCSVVDRTARVWVDTKNRGVLIAFNLGDGDLTAAEVAWATRTVLANRTLFKIPSGGIERMFGAYANATNSACFVYPHPDHVAVHTALANNRFGPTTQGAATCASSPGVTMITQVSEDSMRAAWEIGPNQERIGAHPFQYGWLHGTYYPLDKYGQKQIFHGRQAFWTR
jgi:hypothetical protein